MNDVRKLKEQHGDLPGFDNYLNCMSRSLLSGVASFWLGFSGLYFGQKLLQRQFLPYPIKYNILISALVASGISYKITKDKTSACQYDWVETAKEERRAAITDN